jgi:hypothetical protein
MGAFIYMGQMFKLHVVVIILQFAISELQLVCAANSIALLVQNANNY